MTAEFIKIANFIITAFLHIWPYLVITIPIAVAVNMSGAARHIKRAFYAGPITAIFLATIVGAFSPFCSCGVIPVIAALLIGGVPLAPVMSFWIASPSMDPEIFFLSVGTIGWNLAVWRLVGTLILSLAAGFITYYLSQTKWIPKNVLKNTIGLDTKKRPSKIQNMIQNTWRRFSTGVKNQVFLKPKILIPAAACCDDNPSLAQILDSTSYETILSKPDQKQDDQKIEPCGCGEKQDFWRRLLKESYSASLMVAKFMALAFFLEAIIILYIPGEWITSIMGQKNSWAIIMAAFLGIPVYTSNLSALPMVSGLLTQGMSQAAALAFLIAGPTTTLPAMAAVWTLVTYRVFILYVSFALFGAVILGYLKLFLG